MSGSESRVEKIRLQGIELQVRYRGCGPAHESTNKPKMLVLHGGGGPITGLPFAEALARSHVLIEPVHPGFAGSSIPHHFDGMEDLVYCYLDLLDALDLQDVIVLGTSMGGWLAAEIAVRNAQRIRQLVLVDAVGVKVGGRDDRDIVDVFASSSAQLLECMWHDPAKAPDLTQMEEPQLQIMAANRTALSLYTWDPYMHNPKLPGRLHRIQCPTLFLWGESDRLVSVDYGRAYSKMIAGAIFQAIPAAGHMPYIEQPELFSQAVQAFTLAGKTSACRAEV